MELWNTIKITMKIMIMKRIKSTMTIKSRIETLLSLVIVCWEVGEARFRLEQLCHVPLGDFVDEVAANHISPIVPLAYINHTPQDRIALPTIFACRPRFSTVPGCSDSSTNNPTPDAETFVISAFRIDPFSSRIF